MDGQSEVQTSATSDAPANANIEPTAASANDGSTSAETPKATPASSRPTVAARSTSVRSAGSSSSRGAAGPKRVFKPVFTGRRSKEERDRIAAEQEARKKEQQDKENRGRGRGRDSRGGRGRGGYVGENRGKFVPGAVASGPFSAGVVAQNIGGRSSRGRGSGFGIGGSGGTIERLGGGTKSAGPKIKKEIGIKSETDADLARELGIEIKTEAEDGGYISSDPDEAIHGPRKDVNNFIDLVSSDEEGGDEPRSQRTTPGLMPIRIKRKEHQDRVMGINTDASSATAAELNKQKDRAGGITSVDAAATSAVKKGKAKARDVEFTGTKKLWRGAWSDPSDRLTDVRIKEEPMDQDEGPEPVEAPPDTTQPSRHTAVDTDDAAVKEPPSSPELHRRAQIKEAIKRKTQTHHHARKPVLQTDEDRREWQRRIQDDQNLVLELGNLDVNVKGKEKKDGEGDTSMEGEEEKRDPRADRVYLFQLPPVIPDLLSSDEKDGDSGAGASGVKPELSSPELRGKDIMAVDPAPPPPTSTKDKPIKIEEDAPNANIAAGGVPSLHPSGPQFTSGLAGKLRIHQSGKATLNWGGTSLQLSMGTDARFLQDVVLMRMKDEDNDGAREGSKTPGPGGRGGKGGDVLAFGHVMGKFVVTPDWEEILG